jgi:hypothetical protein
MTKDYGNGTFVDIHFATPITMQIIGLPRESHIILLNRAKNEIKKLRPTDKVRKI